ncbi:MAG: choline-sulfatase [Acidimicrobiia bacterium]|nr:choline-sulfatase [Acidimicrobiia bacterium]
MDRPNILVVMADQLAPHFTGAYGHPLVRTPAMDALAERGVRFDAAYCSSPLCAPSRFSMMSGRLASEIGAFDNGAEFEASIPTVAHYLRLAGYRTTLSGKMHFVGPDQLHGFEERLTTDVYPSDFAWAANWDAATERMDKWFNNVDTITGAGPVLANFQIDFDDEVGFTAVRRLYDLARPSADERPFFLVASFTHPHDPYEARPEWWNLYDPDDIDPPEPIRDDAVDPHTLRIRQGTQADIAGYTEAQCRTARHGYYAATSYFDCWLGRLVDALAQTGRLDSTVVIVTSDHGDMLGDRGVFFKMSFFERSARVPLIMAGPGIAPGTTVTNACSLLDLLPTLLEIASGGGARPEFDTPISGRSLWELACGGTDDVDETVSEYMAVMTSHPLFMIRRGRHKYIHCDSDPPLLYDVEADPLERSNLAGDPEHAGLASAFAAETAERWDSAAIRERVVASQRSRRLVRSAIGANGHGWDYRPERNVTTEYVRDHMTYAQVGAQSRVSIPS